MMQPTAMPKPRMALQIGIAGHRSNKLDPESQMAVDHALPICSASRGFGMTVGCIIALPSRCDAQNSTQACHTACILQICGLESIACL